MDGHACCLALSAVQHTPNRTTAILTGLLALALVTTRPVWRRISYFDTAVHEGGHALMASLTGRREIGVRLESDTSGTTSHTGPGRGLGRIVISAAGYVAPSTFGASAAGLLSTGNITAAFVLGGIAVFSLLFLVENGFGALVVLVLLAVVVVVAGYAAAAVQGVVACTLTWLLLLGAVRSVKVLWQNRHYSWSDADTLASLTHLPAVVWIGFFFVVDLYCLLLGGRLLIQG